MPSFVCFAKNCGFQTSAPTEAELMTKIAEHAKTVHKMDPIPPDVMVKNGNGRQNKARTIGRSGIFGTISDSHHSWYFTLLDKSWNRKSWKCC
jgi:predicted small metal-binding protein